MKQEPKKLKITKDGSIILKGESMFRIRLVLSVLSHTPITITEIRENSEEPGLSEREVYFAKILAEIANGTKLSINETGTRISFQPGIASGGEVSMVVNSNVDLGWIIEGLLPVAPFCKNPLKVSLSGGITDSESEVGVNLLRAVSLKILSRFGVEGSTIECHKRGFSPSGGGSVNFFCPIIRKHLTTPVGLDQHNLKVLKIRGVAQASRVNPQLANRIATTARSELEVYAADAFINTDCRSNRTKDAGLSPGYGLSLWAELIDPTLAETTHKEQLPITSFIGSSGAYSGEDDTPERLAQRISLSLLSQISNRGSIDQQNQSLIIILMANCPEEVVRVNFGKHLTDHAMGTLREVQRFLKVQFKIVEKDGIITLSCLGNGVGNFSRSVT